ncbi:MAG: anion permease [Deltaproteobacteria bacterium]|nr:anion permease [Deltaproteobacteria bacterium]
MWRVTSGIFLGWSLGANDASNIFGTGVATGTVRYRTAIWLTALFVMAGALVEGPKCMKTIGDLSRILPQEAFYCTLSAAITMTILTYLAIPASASQCVVGALLGAGILSGTADFSKLNKIIICWVFTPITGLILGYILYRMTRFMITQRVKTFTSLNTIYVIGIILAGSYGAYSLGANNVANVTGMYVSSGIFSMNTAAFIGGLSIAFGVVTYSKKVMITIGKGIVPLDPLSALVSVLAEALTLHVFTQVGVPVSSSQAIVGAVAGVGLVGGVRTLSVKILSKIFIGWILTPVASGILTFMVLLIQS